MNFQLPFRLKFQVWTDWFGLVLMSWAAPAVAFLLCQFHFCFYMGYNMSFVRFLYALLCCAIPAIPTFLVLLPLRKRALHRWIAWIICTLGWALFLLYIARV
jgi:hypothetical protein